MSYNAIGDNILVKPSEQTEKKSKSGLILTEETRSTLVSGTVISAGEGDWKFSLFTPNPFKVGDVILYPKNRGSRFDIDFVEHVFLKIADVVALVKNEN